MATAAQQSGGAVQQQQQQQQQQRPKVNDQVDGDLQDWVKNFSAMVVPGTHASFARAWSGVGEHEMFSKLMAAVRELQPKLLQGSSLRAEVAAELKARANKHYTDRQFNAAAAFYTRALMYADSMESIAVLACNRSAVMIEQGLPLAALLDASYAAKADPNYTKANERVTKCLQLLKLTEMAALSDGAEKTKRVAAFLADALREGLDGDVREAEGSNVDHHQLHPAWQPTLGAEDSTTEGATNKGRHVTASSEVPKGSLVLSERPVASVVRGEGLLCTCSYCHRQTMCLYPSRAHVERKIRSRGLFCSDECAEAAWRSYGEYESRHPFWLACPVDILLASRLVRRAQADPNVKARLATLKTWSQEQNPGATVGGFETGAVCAAVAFEALDPLKGDAIVEAMRAITCNAFPVTFTDRVAPGGSLGGGVATSAVPHGQHSFVKMNIAKGFYLHASWLNHSCSPNCTLSFRGNPYRVSDVLVVKANRAIMEGEELTVAYDGMTSNSNHSTRGRIRDLRAAYGFACACASCFNNVDEPVSKEEQAHYVKAADYYQKGRRLLREGDAQSAADVLRQSLEIVMRYICPPPRPPQFVVAKTHDAIAQAFQALGEKAKCIEHVTLAIETLVKLEGPDSLDLAREYAKLSSLAAQATEAELPDKEAKSREAAAEAARLLRLHYAPSKALEAEISFLEGELSELRGKPHAP